MVIVGAAHNNAAMVGLITSLRSSGTFMLETDLFCQFEGNILDGLAAQRNCSFGAMEWRALRHHYLTTQLLGECTCL